MTPKNLWYSLMGRYNPSQAVWGHMTKPKQGQDYGNPRFDMYNLMWLTIQGENIKGTVTTEQGPAVPCGGSTDHPCSK